MVSNALGQVLDELGKTSLIGILGLVPDKNNSCLIKIGDGLQLQIELDKSEQYLLLGSVLGIPGNGPMRADLFREALKANQYFIENPSEPRYGIFAFSKRTRNLILFDTLFLNGLTGDKVAEFLVPFLDKAKKWTAAIRNNELPPNLPTSSAKGVGGIFGLFK